MGAFSFCIYKFLQINYGNFDRFMLSYFSSCFNPTLCLIKEENDNLDTVLIYTDGACSGNPGKGGWGAVLIYNGVEKQISGASYETTNNQMELTRTN